MQRFGGQASFVSAGGYHHHLGLNTWAGIGAAPPPSSAARLGEFELIVPDGAIMAAIYARLHDAGCEVAPAGDGWAVLDPSSNRVVLRPA
jgi:catechol 2,3-dioxygenase